MCFTAAFPIMAALPSPAADNGGFAIACGLTDIIEYVKNLHFTEADIEFLRGKGIFDEKFLKYLRKFKFTGDIYAVPEGTPVFPYEPIITVKAPAAEAQLMETFILLCVNHQSCIATWNSDPAGLRVFPVQ